MKLTHFIGGKQVEADTPFNSINPSNTDEVVASYPAGGKAVSRCRPTRPSSAPTTGC